MSERAVPGFKHTVELFPKAPFNFDATMHKPDHFPSSDNEWEPGIRWQTMRWQDMPLGLKFENEGTVDRPGLSLSVYSRDDPGSNFLDGLVDEITCRYSLQMDLTEFNKRFENDPQLGPIVARWRGMRPLNCSSLYEYLIIAIVLQNATVRRSVNMMQALFESYGTLLSYDGKDLYGFWGPEAVHQATEQELRDLKVGYRAKSIKRVTEAFVREEIDEFELRSRSREEQREALLSLGGYKMLAVHYIWEDLFWKRKNEHIDWLEKLIRL